jgi:hypothetical protein
MANPKKATPSAKAALNPADESLFQSAEDCFQRTKPALDALATNDIKTPTIDVQEAAVIVLGIDGLLREPSTKAKIAALIKSGLLDGNLLENLSDVARAAWFSRYRLLQVSATHSEAALPIALVEEALTLRRRMLKTLDYNLDDDPDAVVRLNAIRSGAGHLDMANDLLANADFYRERKSDIEHDQKNYRKTDEADARRLADKILRLLGAVTTPEQTLWKNNQARAFTLLLSHYEEARRAGRFLFHYEEGEKMFPSLFSAVRSAPAPRAEKPAAEPPAPAEATAAE